MNFGKRDTYMPIRVGLIVGIIILLVFLGKMFESSPKQQVSRVAAHFYSYEQKGDFSSSWELFHPVMQNRFAKGAYAEDRAHVFMNHFGVDTFGFEISKPKKVKNWMIDEETGPIPVVYSLTVAQTYYSKYGDLAIVQQIVAVEDEGVWKIVWTYN